jgi:nitrile hydratase accessory protein
LTQPELAGRFSAPGDADGPVFDEPWQAQAFALAIELHQRGAFTWPEWARTLGEALREQADSHGSETYYSAWVTALETIAAAKGLTDAAALAGRRLEWEAAYRETPHGRPVALGRAR